jgi:hypothetical protein
VAFTLRGPTTAYPDFFNALREYDDWFNYIPGLWIIVTTKALVTVASELRSRIRTTDWLIVMPAKGPVDGWLPEVAWNWINSKIPNKW